MLAESGTALETLQASPSVQVFVSGWSEIEGVMALAPEREFNADVRAVVAAANERAEGYEAALAEAGIPIDSTLIEPGDFSEQSGTLAMRQLLDRPKGRPDAVFVGSDTMAAGALRAVYESGLSVPGDIAVFGFDGLQLQMQRHPNLSTVVQSPPTSA